VSFQVVPAQVTGLAAPVADAQWTGKQLKPAPKVTFGGVPLVNGVDYTLSYGANKAIGKGTVTVTGKGNFAGAKSVAFNVVPKKNKVSKATAGKKQVAVSWSKVSKSQKVSKYEVRYRTKGTSKWTTKAFDAKVAKATVKKLKKGKVYQFQVRSYKTVSGAKYYSPWSATKASKKVK
jgi:fibronectin type 3 domain-containing protein